ncbi:MAG: metallophosphoesterase [bacterium]|nr:metallophosphoesterase [bacterium]
MKKFWAILLLLCSFAVMQKVQAKELKFVQITDTNFTLDIDDEASAERAKQLKQAIKDINKDRSIKFVVFTGNSVRHPDRKELVAFFKLANKLHKPYYVVIGNKEVLRYKHFTKKNFMHAAWLHCNNMRFKKPNYVFVPNKDIAFIVLDGVNEMMPVPSGNYRPETLEWLDKQLNKYENKKVVILQHFPIVSPSDKPVYDAADLNKYMQTINSYDNVLAIISGHFNADATTYRKGVYHISSPAFSAPYYKYKVIEIQYEPKYLFATPSEFVINQKIYNMIEPKDVPEETEGENADENITNINNVNTQEESTIQEQK